MRLVEPAVEERVTNFAELNLPSAKTVFTKSAAFEFWVQFAQHLNDMKKLDLLLLSLIAPPLAVSRQSTEQALPL